MEKTERIVIRGDEYEIQLNRFEEFSATIGLTVGRMLIAADLTENKLKELRDACNMMLALMKSEKR